MTGSEKHKKKENKMRILVALITVFMVSGAVAQTKPTANISPEDGDIRFTNTEAKCQSHYVAPSGPVYACKDPKTGKVVNIECKVPPGVKMPKELSGAELQKGYGKMCYVPDGRNDGEVS